MKAAIDQVKELCAGQGEDFAEMRDEYLRLGVVVVNPQAALFALPIRVDGVEAWFVKAAAGNIRLLRRMFPCWKPLVVFHRDKGAKRTRVYKSERLVGRIK